MTRRALYAALVAVGLGSSAMAQAPAADNAPAAEEQGAGAVEEQSADIAESGSGVVVEAESDVVVETESGTRKPRARDPFRPFTLDLRPVETDQPLTPLQRYELAQLRVAAILLNLIPPRALLEDNSGMGFIVTPGTPIGRHRGVVAAIEPRTVIVEEKALDFYGREQVNRVAMEMAEESDVQGGIQE